MSAVPLESHSLSFWQSALQKQIFRVLSQLQHGRVTVESGDQRETFGSAGKDHLEVVIRVEDPQLYRRMAWEGSLGAAESFLQGEWTCDNLVNFFRILCRNMDHLASLDSGWSKLMTTVATWGHRKNRNDKSALAGVDLPSTPSKTTAAVSPPQPSPPNNTTMQNSESKMQV